MRASFRWLPFASLCALAGCGAPRPTSDADAGTTLDIVGDDDAPVCSDLRCPSGSLAHACVCVPAPRTYETVRTSCAQISTPSVSRTPDEDFCVDGAPDQPPDLGCFGERRRAPLAPRPVTLYGVVDVFGNGPDADAITVEVYREGADAQLGELVGTATASTASPCHETEIEIENDEPTGKERQLGFYAIPGVPTETPLIVVTRGDPGLWKPLYTYNIVILDEEVENAAAPGGACADLPGGDRHRYRARIVSVVDYRAIPRASGLAGGIASGHGAIAGEIHDCGNVRLSFAQVALSAPAEAFTYFSDDADNPLPNLSRIEGTSLLGLWAGLGVEPGPVTVSAVGLVDGQVVSLGWYTARVFADAVTSVSLRGLRPHQVRESAP